MCRRCRDSAAVTMTVSVTASRIAETPPASAANAVGAGLSAPSPLMRDRVAFSIAKSVSTTSRLRRVSLETRAWVTCPRPHPSSIVSPRAAGQRPPAAFFMRAANPDASNPCSRVSPCKRSAPAGNGLDSLMKSRTPSVRTMVRSHSAQRSPSPAASTRRPWHSGQCRRSDRLIKSRRFDRRGQRLPGRYFPVKRGLRFSL